MNKFSWWINLLVLVIVLAGCLLALPNIYGSVEAVQIADNDGEAFEEAKLEEFVRVVEGAGIEPEASYLQDGRVVIRLSLIHISEPTRPSKSSRMPSSA